jgi:hypothetical protein
VNSPAWLIRAAQEHVSALTNSTLTSECEKLVAVVRERCPDAFPHPLPPGGVGAPIDITPDEAAKVFGVAFSLAVAGGTTPASGDVVWTSGDDELLVHTGTVRLILTDGFAIVGIEVFTEQTGDVQVSVPFALGGPGSPLGFVVGTETVPRGPALVVHRWGTHLQGAAWQALVHSVAGVAAAAGADDQNQPLLPAALTATANGLTVLPQARHTFDRTAS